MGFRAFLEHWWNVPFLLAVALAVAFAGLQLVFAAFAGDADAELEVDADIDADAVLWPGVDQVPITAVVLPLLFVGGLSGLFVNRIAWLQGGYPAWMFPLSLLVAVGAGGCAARAMSRLAARLVDTSGRGAALKAELVGRAGVVASARLDDGFGTVRLSDEAGHELLVPARLPAGEAALPRGAGCVLVELLPDSHVFVAAPL